MPVMQLALQDHPRRNALFALQFSLQSALDLAKYALTLGLASPNDFKFASLVSIIAVVVGAVLYSVYSRLERGHLIHLERWANLIAHKAR